MNTHRRRKVKKRCVWEEPGAGDGGGGGGLGGGGGGGGGLATM